MMNNPVKFISWNVKGVNNATKRRRVMSHLQQLKVDIAFLQETHLCNNNIAWLKQHWVGHVFHSTFNAKARGTVILINKGISFESKQVIKDPNGRYVIVVGQLFSNPVVLVNIYAPNFDDPHFFEKMFSLIPNMDTHFLLVGGDLNLVLEVNLDRSSKTSQNPSRSAGVVKNFMNQCGLSDVWRFKFPQTRAYSFFSNVHHTYSRIDYFLLDNRLLPKVKAISYNSIVISDHGAVVLDLNIPNRPPINRIWRLNPLLLSDDIFVELISNQIQFFLETNTSPEISQATLWETLKAYIRGQIIAYAARVKKEKSFKMTEISQRILDIDSIYAHSPNSDLYKERLRLQSEYNLLSTEEAARLILKSRHNVYEHGDKASRLLARQARQAAASRSITKIQSHTGEILTDHNDINKAFQDFYVDLYTSECRNDTLLNTFFENITVPTVSEEQNEKLNADISISEIITAIKSMQNNKSPGPDGFTVEFYKKFPHQLAPILQAMYSEALSTGSLPTTLRQASITLLAKKDKDPLLCTSYRPISLLNVDFKVLSKVLAKRLESVVPDVVSPDQTGFVLGRHSYSNLRKLFNIIHSVGSKCPEVVISLDAEKAFDRVEFAYLFFTLKKFGVGDGFISWIKLLYSSPLASVVSNNIQSCYFNLGRGTRQGCPLSPLLFALAIEPLAIALRLHKDFKGVKRKGQEYKVSLYADDLLLYVSDPESSLPSILDTLNGFGEISGYKVNFQKSELLPLNSAAAALPPTLFPFRMVQEHFRYLGIEVTLNLSTTFTRNFTSLLKKCKQDMMRWTSLPLSLAGRVSLIKMIILPKFLYLFQNIPILIKKSFFKTLDKSIIPFIWGNKSSRISKTMLQRSKSTGGLALPNFMFYYWACNIQKLIHWVEDTPMTDRADWVQLELASCPTLSSLVFSSLPLLGCNLSSNVIVNNSLRIWAQFRRHFGFQAASSLSPITSNHMFTPSCTDTTFNLWFNKGIKTINNLYKDNIFISFAQLAETYDLPKTHFFRYLQIRSFVKKTFTSFPEKPPETQYDSIFWLNSNAKGLIARMYGYINNINPHSTEHLKRAWDNDLGVTMTKYDWEAVLDLIHTSSTSALHGLIQLKVVHRVHLTQARLARIYPNVEPFCPRCRGQPADLIHMFWLCPKLSSFWQDIFKAFSEMFGTQFNPNPISAVFGLIPEECRDLLPNKAYVIIAFSTLLARRLILLKWKQQAPPSFVHWIKEVLYFLKLERIKYTIKGSTQAFVKTWRPFWDYYDSLQEPLDME